MIGFTVRRLLQMAFVLWGVATLVFLMMVVVPPGDPVRTIVPRATSPEVVQQVRTEWGFDRPLTRQYGEWISDLSHLDLRSSYTKGKRPVTDLIKERLPRSATLALIAFVLELLFGVFTGVVAAVRRYSFWDYLATVSTTVLVALPVFWIGALLQYAFGWAEWMPGFLKLPPVGYEPITDPDGWRYYILPAITLAAVSTAFLARVVRSEMLEVLDLDFIRTARAKGLSERRVVVRHGLRNALIPVITLVALDLGVLIGSAIITEAVFGFEGVGLAIVNAIDTGDTPVVMGFTLVVTAIFVLLNFIADLAYAVADPRVRHTGGAR